MASLLFRRAFFSGFGTCLEGHVGATAMSGFDIAVGPEHVVDQGGSAPGNVVVLGEGSRGRKFIAEGHLT